jgi:YidC/Oxa1 family membrane protein insertase
LSFGESEEKRHVINSEEGLSVSAPNVTTVGLNDHYFAMALVDNSAVAPKFETNVPKGAKSVIGRLVYAPASRVDSLTIKYDGFAGPKALNVLRGIDERLTRLIDYGIFKAIAKPLLWLLRFFHDLVGNWGVAIILLTILVRLVVMPFNIYSFKSMKVMQKIQPEMKLLREKYKSDPARMNQEVMGLMKKHKANPLGGCLPMLLQIPVFIALFSALSMSIELYMQPFGLWIHDLSVKDPLYVIPVLMGVAMFFQQKLTPTTMDPAQAKVMQWMPVIFAAMMLGLPSGLTLYILVSTVFGVVQQWIFMRDRTPAPATA